MNSLPTTEYFLGWLAWHFLIWALLAFPASFLASYPPLPPVSISYVLLTIALQEVPGMLAAFAHAALSLKYTSSLFTQ